MKYAPAPVLRLTPSKRRQDLLAGMPILRQAHLGLKRPDGRLGALANPAVDLAIIVAERRQPLLQLLLFVERKLGERPAPVVDEATIAGDLVGKKADGERVFVGIVVGLD